MANFFYKKGRASVLSAFSFVLLVVIALFASSCKTVPKKSEIPKNLSIHELSLRGQNELDRNNYAAAVVYYEVIIERYRNNMRYVTAAEYEIAHIRVKQKNWRTARRLLERIIARYNGSGGASLPAEYLVLAQNDLKRVLEEQSSSASSKKKK